MSEQKGSLSGKKALVVGVANQRSIAYGIAARLRAAGAEVAITYQSDRFEKKVKKLAEDLGVSIVERCDLTSDKELESLVKVIEDKWGALEIVVHSVAYADAKNLQGRLVDVSAENFAMALNISAYTLMSLTRATEHLLKKDGGSVIALSYYGAHKVFKGYHLMGVAKAALETIVRYLANELGKDKIRVNTISAGAVKTLAASGVPGIQAKLDRALAAAPIKENISTEDVGELVVFLSGEGGKRITGGTMYVDSGANILGED
jgi:enoyl-[acyl-carrier protein] reductase I